MELARRARRKKKPDRIEPNLKVGRGPFRLLMFSACRLLRGHTFSAPTPAVESAGNHRHRENGETGGLGRRNNDIRGREADVVDAETKSSVWAERHSHGKAIQRVRESYGLPRTRNKRHVRERERVLFDL